MARHAKRPGTRVIVGSLAAAAVAVTVVALIVLPDASRSPTPRAASSTTSKPTVAPSTSPPTSTTTTLPPGFVAGHVTAVGDSVMLDYQAPLQVDIPGINVQAAVDRQWEDGETVLQQDKAANDLGADVIVALGTNGPITQADFDTMMGILDGAAKIVFVNVHVDRPWQDPNNALLAAGAKQYGNVLIADWATLANQNPSWFGADGTHLAVNGPGADALAALVAHTLSSNPS